MPTNAGFTPAAAPECAYSPRMTRAQAMALATAGALDPNCVVVLTDTPAIGTAGNTSATEVELNPVSATELGQAARVHTGFAAEAWTGIYSIATNLFERLEDNKGNVVDDPSGVMVASRWPWHNTSVVRNYVNGVHTLGGWDAILAGGVTIADNIITGPANNITFTNVPNGTITMRGNTFRNGATFGMSMAAGGTLALTDCIFDTANINRVAGASANLTMTRTTCQNASISQQATSTGSPITLSDAVVRDGFILHASGTGALAVFNSTLENHGTAFPGDLQHAGATGTTVFDSRIMTGQAGTVSILNQASSGGSMSINRCNVVDASLSRQAGATAGYALSDVNMVGGQVAQGNGATSGALSLANTDILQSFVNHNGPGAINISSGCRFAGGATVQNSATATRQLSLSSVQVLDQSILNQNRTGGTGVDSLTGTTIDGVSTVTLAGALDPGVNHIMLNRCFVHSSSTITITDPSAAATGGIILQNVHAHSATVTCPAGCGLTTSARFSMQTINLGAFNGHGGIIVEGLPAAKTLTAVNVAKLANKSFDDTI